MNLYNLSTQVLPLTKRALTFFTDSTHTKLILNEDAYRKLHSLNAPFGVVSVVGPVQSSSSLCAYVSSITVESLSY